MGALAACSSGSAEPEAAAASATPSPATTAVASPNTSPASASPTATPAATPTTTAGAATKPVDPDSRYATVALGRFAKDPAAQGFAAYAVARARADLAYDANTPALVATASARVRSYAASVNEQLRSKGQRAGAPRWSVVAVSRTGSNATVRACLWGPSSANRDARTGKVVEQVPARWYPGTLTMTGTAGRWKVAQAAEGQFSCKDAA